MPAKQISFQEAMPGERSARGMKRPSEVRSGRSQFFHGEQGRAKGRSRTASSSGAQAFGAGEAA